MCERTGAFSAAVGFRPLRLLRARRRRITMARDQSALLELLDALKAVDAGGGGVPAIYAQFRQHLGIDSGRAEINSAAAFVPVVPRAVLCRRVLVFGDFHESLLDK